MIKAIVYRSNTGYTKKYAELLSQTLGVPAYTDAEAKESVVKHAEVAYLGWLMAGFIQGYKKASRRYDVRFVCGVGMGTPTDAERTRIAQQNKVCTDNFELLQGGFDLKKLKGMYYFMMKSMSEGVGKKLEEKPDKTDEECLMLDMMKNGGDYVSEDAAASVADKIKLLG